MNHKAYFNKKGFNYVQMKDHAVSQGENIAKERKYIDEILIFSCEGNSEKEIIFFLLINVMI